MAAVNARIKHNFNEKVSTIKNSYKSLYNKA